MVKYTTQVIVDVAAGLGSQVVDEAHHDPGNDLYTADFPPMHEGACGAAADDGSMCTEGVDWAQLGDLGAENAGAALRTMTGVLERVRLYVEEFPLAAPLVYVAMGVLLAIVCSRLMRHARE